MIWKAIGNLQRIGDAPWSTNDRPLEIVNKVLSRANRSAYNSNQYATTTPKILSVNSIAMN